MNNNIMPNGPYLPCLKEGESTYTFTPEVISALLRKAYADGYRFAKSIYNIPEPNFMASTEIAKETNHGTD